MRARSRPARTTSAYLRQPIDHPSACSPTLWTRISKDAISIAANDHLPSTRCSHKYRQLPLIAVEEFLALHPEHADADENDLMVARIEHERMERESLEKQRQDLLKRKAKLIADNKKRKDDLANLDRDLEKFIDVSRSCRLPDR